MKNVKGYKVKIEGDKLPVEHQNEKGWIYPEDMEERIVFADVDAIYFEFRELKTKEEALRISCVNEKDLIYLPKTK